MANEALDNAKERSLADAARPAIAAKADDLEAMRDAVVDAAAVSGGLWLSYLFVLFYLLIAAGGVTHKDLFFESPVKLPFLGVDLPLKGFFWLGPAIFLVVHAYVLLHFALLAGKVGAFHSALEAQLPGSGEHETRTKLRRLLPNNIFVQYLAGPGDVRDGALGFMLKQIAWISLLIAPIALLVFFQLQFLPYHGVWITWWQRIAVTVDLILLWILWPAIVHGRTISDAFQGEWRGTRRTLSVVTLVALPVVFLIATFPGEWLDEHLPPSTIHRALVAGKFNEVTLKPESLWSNVLLVPRLDAVDHAKFDTDAKLSAVSETIGLRDRDLRGAVLFDANLLKADLAGAQLQGARLGGAQLQGANLYCAQLEGAELKQAQLQGAVLGNARLQGASLNGAQLQGASLNRAQLQGALLNGAQLQGASLNGAQLQGASLNGAQLQGASLAQADQRNCDPEQLLGASHPYAQVWRANILKAAAVSAHVVEVNTDRRQLIPCKEVASFGPCVDTYMFFVSLRHMIETEVPAGNLRDNALKRIDLALDPNVPLDDDKIAAQWHKLEAQTASSDWAKAMAETWRRAGCDGNGAPYVVTALAVRIEHQFNKAPAQASALANAFLNPACDGARGISDQTRAHLKELADLPP